MYILTRNIYGFLHNIMHLKSLFSWYMIINQNVTVNIEVIIKNVKQEFLLC